MRSKEEAHDYRYFPEPDLVPVIVSEEWIEKIKKTMPELPDQKFDRFLKEYGLPEYDAQILTEEKALAEWFEKAVVLGGKPKEVSNWIMVELLRLLNEDAKDITECKLTPQELVELLTLIEKGTINRNTAKDVFEEMYKTGKSAETIVKEKGLTQISDSSVIIEAIREIIAKNPKEVERFKAGEEKLIGFFVGQVMKLTKGKANPKLVNELILQELKKGE